jgi:hypothetical protein
MLDREDILRLMDEMADHQRRKVLEIAREAIPGVTEEDLRNPQDFPALNASARFNYEDGILSGYLGVKMALLNEINRKNAG